MRLKHQQNALCLKGTTKIYPGRHRTVIPIVGKSKRSMVTYNYITTQANPKHG